MRIRTAYTVGGSLLIILCWVANYPALIFTNNPTYITTSINIALCILSGVILATLLFITRKAMMDYDAADFEKLGERAARSPEASAAYAIAVSIQTLAYAIVIVGGFAITYLKN